MTASSKRRAQKRRAAERESGRCCPRVTCSCPGPTRPAPTLDEKLRALGPLPRAQLRHR